MAMSAELKSIYNDVKNYGKANWDMSAMTSDGKVINRTLFGLILKWLPRAIIPSWLKCKITNANVTTACPKVREKLKAVVTYYKTESDPAKKDAIKVDYTKAINNLNNLVERVNCKRPFTAQLARFDLENIDARRNRKTVDANTPPARVQPSRTAKAKNPRATLGGNAVVENKFRKGKA
jgi:hypothetical protein